MDGTAGTESSTPIDDEYRRLRRFAVAMFACSWGSALLVWYIIGSLRFAYENGRPPVGFETLEGMEPISAPPVIAVAPFAVGTAVAFFLKAANDAPSGEPAADHRRTARRALINNVGFACCVGASMAIAFLGINDMQRAHSMVDLSILIPLVALCSLLASLFEHSDEEKLRSLEQIDCELNRIHDVG